MLLVFEKILMGLADDVVIQHGNHYHIAIETVIANLYKLFDPWFTPPEFLDWLASWVGLKLFYNWDEYQRRKAIGEITQIYWQRGLKTSLSQYLALYSVVETRPRIAIDNGNKILFSQPLPGQSVPVHSLVSQGYSHVLKGQYVQADPVPFSGLIRPSCIAVAPDGSLFVGDLGTQGGIWPFEVKSQVWGIGPMGSYSFASTVADTPLVPPQPISPSNWNLNAVVAIAVRNLSPTSWEVYVLDSNGDIYRLLPNASQILKNITQQPIAMAVDTDNKNLLILDHGDGTDTNPPKIIRVELSTKSITPHNLTQVIEPLSLLVQPDKSLIIGDGRKQPDDVTKLLPSADLPGNLVLVDRSNDANWNEQVLLTGPNPLVAPTAVVHEDDTHVLVLDVGLKPFAPDTNSPFVSQVAEPAAVYRVDLKASTVMLAAEPGNLVYPTGMAFSGGSLFICDPGQPEIGLKGLGDVSPLICRVLPHEFGVAVHFCIPRSPQEEPTQDAVRSDIIAGIRSIVDREKPAHTLYQLITEV